MSVCTNDGLNVYIYQYKANDENSLMGMPHNLRIFSNEKITTNPSFDCFGASVATQQPFIIWICG